MSRGYWQALSIRKLWEENTRAVTQGQDREIELTAAELMRRTDTSPAAIEASKERCAARRRQLRKELPALEPEEVV